ncbi:hypothetical protein ACIRCZ_06735 [Leifsonia sp. NPDC102414]|uniref:hypothetical protein n=1 Tax=Leifsonia sp. NPDC102414 TaxID=3364124 RepID=UPI0037F764D5
MGAARRLALTAWRADDGRMRVAAWLASAAALLGIGLAWSALRVIGLYALWTVGMSEGVLFATEFGTRALLLALTVVCVVLGVARRAARGAGFGWLIAAILLAGLLVVVQVVQLAYLTHFDPRSLFTSTSLTWLGFAALTLVACALALTARRPTALRAAPDSEQGRSAQAAGPYLWFSVAAAFVAFVACVLAVAQALIVPNAWGPAIVALVQAGVTVVVVTVQVVATLFVQRGSALARLVVSAVAVVLLGDATESSLLGVGGDGGGLQLGLLVATVCALAAAVPLWLPPVSRYLADAAAGRSDAHAEERARAAV